jgi:site-specific DNA-cytosine methylase
MSYLQDSDYFGFIDNAIQLESGSAGIYFYSVYKIHKEDNPDFIERLDHLVNGLNEKLEIAKQEVIANKSHNETMSKGLQLTDSANSYDWDSHTFYFQQGRVSHSLCSLADTNFSHSEFSKLKIGVFQLEKMSEQGNVEKSKSKEHSPKLNWTLQKNQLYYVFRQLKNEHNAISMSYDKIAEFIKENVVGFETTEKGTIEKELKKDLDDSSNLSKSKRIKVQIDKD